MPPCYVQSAMAVQEKVYLCLSRLLLFSCQSTEGLQWWYMEVSVRGEDLAEE